MTTLAQLITRQHCRCHYCGTTMLVGGVARNHSQYATKEHLIDKWSSPEHQKIEDDSNLVAACFTCNNSRGNERNKIARNYYQQLIGAKQLGKKVNASSLQSKQLYKMFGPVPQELFA